jgi:hypothetical protein
VGASDLSFRQRDHGGEISAERRHTIGVRLDQRCDRGATFQADPQAGIVTGGFGGDGGIGLCANGRPPDPRHGWVRDAGRHRRQFGNSPIDRSANDPDSTLEHREVDDPADQSEARLTVSARPELARDPQVSVGVVEPALVRVDPRPRDVQRGGRRSDRVEG